MYIGFPSKQALSVAVFSGCCVLAHVFAGPRLPFEDLCWLAGSPLVKVDGRWRELRAVDGISQERLVERAVILWGPAYQDHFGLELETLLSQEGAGWALWRRLELGQETERRLATAPRWRSHHAALVERYPVSPGGSSSPGAAWISRETGVADLTYLDGLMARRYAYLPLAVVEYRAALDSMRGSLGPRIKRRDFALQIDRLLALFGDGHSRVRFRESDVALPPSRTRKSAATRAIDWKIVPKGIGYLEMRSSMPPGDQARQEIVDAMQELHRTRSMILDVRGNSGGSRDPVLTLLGFFLPRGRPVVVNVAALRMDEQERPPESHELLRERQLFSRGSPRWSRQESEAIEALFENFRPLFAMSRRLYSDWHVAVLRHHEGSYFYDRPLVALQDKGSGSATDLLLSTLKGRPSVTLMGTTSSGGSGYALPYRLPGSGVVVQLASMASLRPDGSLYTGTPPDVEEEDDPLGRAVERLSR